MISCSCGWQYIAPSIRACHVGWMKPVSCSMVGVRNTGEVSRMKSIQNWPAASAGASGSGAAGAARWTRSSTNPSGSNRPSQLASAAKITV